MEKYGKTRQDTDGITWRMRTAYRQGYRQAQYMEYFCFHGEIGYANAHHYYVTRTLPVIYFDVKVKIRAEITKRLL